MPYSLTIERPAGPITFKEWCEAINSVEGIRLTFAQTHTIKNYNTAEAIGIRASEGDAEILDTEDGRWHSAVLWRDDEGTAQFNARIIGRAVNFNDLTHRPWISLSSVAKLLMAQIRGEEDELYDLNTAQPK